MNSESEVLKTIWENNGETSIKLISNQTGFGADYVRYICNSLSKRGEIKSVKKKQGFYRITAKGEKKLKLLGIFKPKILKEEKGIRKVILPWPKELFKKKTISFLRASTFFTKGRKRTRLRQGYGGQGK